MGRLWQILEEINRVITEKGMEPRITRGRIGLKSGIPLSFTESTPDDSVKEQKILSAAKEVLGVDIKV